MSEKIVLSYAELDVLGTLADGGVSTLRQSARWEAPLTGLRGKGLVEHLDLQLTQKGRSAVATLVKELSDFPAVARRTCERLVVEDVISQLLRYLSRRSSARQVHA